MKNCFRMEVMSCAKCSERSTCSFWLSKTWHSFWMRGLDPLMRYTPCDGGREGKGGRERERDNG